VKVCVQRRDACGASVATDGWTSALTRTELAIGRLVFTRLDGRVIDAAPPMRATGDIVLTNRRHGLAIDAHTGDSLWQGEQIDWSLAVEGIMARTPGWDWPSGRRCAVN